MRAALKAHRDEGVNHLPLLPRGRKEGASAAPCDVDLSHTFANG
jgi:hypothetical protein